MSWWGKGVSILPPGRVRLLTHIPSSGSREWRMKWRGTRDLRRDCETRKGPIRQPFNKESAISTVNAVHSREASDPAPPILRTSWILPHLSPPNPSRLSQVASPIAAFHSLSGDLRLHRVLAVQPTRSDFYQTPREISATSSLPRTRSLPTQAHDIRQDGHLPEWRSSCASPR